VKLRHIAVGTGSTFGGSEPVLADAVCFGDLLFLSGRAPVDPTTLRLVHDTFEGQARAVLRDIGAVLEAAGSSWDHVLRVECFLADAGDFAAWNQIWSERFKPPRPARTTVVTGFAVPGMLIELQMTAGMPDDGE
jgi:2-iminobutanoate/2-iminopropanoate deaminase